jgi:hypothetical protein
MAKFTITTNCKIVNESNITFEVEGKDAREAASNFVENFCAELEQLGDDGVFEFSVTVNGIETFKFEASAIHSDILEND